MSSLFKSQTVKIALGIIIGLGVVIMAALAIDANVDRDMIDQASAKKITLKEAEVSEYDLRSLNIEDANGHYTVTFSTDDRDYCFNVSKQGEITKATFMAKDVSNTEVVKNDVPVTSQEPVKDKTDASSKQDTANASSSNSVAKDNTSKTNSTTSISEAKAKEIALNDAGVKESATSFLFAKKDYDDGREVWEVEFYADGVEYDYEIAVSTGNIISKDHDAEHYYRAQNNTTSNSSSSTISLDEARNIALSKVNGAKASNVRIHLDHDDWQVVYEGEIYYDGMEYEFEIDAQTGNIIEWSVESWWD